MAAERYVVRYGSNSQNVGEISSNSRDARMHGQNLLGSAGGGWIEVYEGNRLVSEARYTPELGGRWYNVVIDTETPTTFVSPTVKQHICSFLNKKLVDEQEEASKYQALLADVERAGFSISLSNLMLRQNQEIEELQRLYQQVCGK